MSAGGRKPDADAIAAFLADLPRELRLDAARVPWTRTAYHYTDVRNAARILAAGELLSRERCGLTGIEFHDAAHRGVIGQSRQVHHYVRLYFRPRTPTQFHMEGIKAEQDIADGAHCPVPVFFLFDSHRLLAREGVLFSDGSLARSGQYRMGGTAEFLATVPFDAVYHDVAYPPSQRDEIVFRRHAEVFTRDSLDLDDLREVVCRSGPERQTLLSLLGPDRATWAGRIRLEQPGERLFLKRELYVTGVLLTDRRLTLQVNATPHTFTCEARVVRLPDRATILDRMRDSVTFRGPLGIELPDVYERLELSFTVNGALAFRGEVNQRTML